MGSCSICCDVLKVPTFCVPCGHVFCFSCIQRWQNHISPRSNMHFGFIPEVTCPECRTVITKTQKIRLEGDLDVPETEEVFEDPWDESNEIHKILRSLNNIWQGSEAKRNLNYAQNKLLSNEIVRNVWVKTKSCGHHCYNFATEFCSVQGGPPAHIDWLKQKSRQGYRNIKNRVVNHHYYQDLQTRWSNLHEDRKLFLTLVAVICVLLLLADCQNPIGFVRSVLVPILQSVIFVISEVLSCFVYCCTRPVICAFNCLIEVLLMIMDIFINIIKMPIVILEMLAWTVYTVVLGLVNFITNTVGVLLRTLIPLVILLYFVYPNFQNKCREILARLQQN